MHRWRKAFELSISEWLLILWAALWLGLVEIGLRVLRFNTLVEKLDHHRPHGRTLVARPHSAERFAYCVELASRLYPLEPTCLKKALVLYALLARKGLCAQLWIGAAKSHTDRGVQIDYHAWVEHEGKVILGAANRERYIPLYCFNRSQAVVCTQGQSIA
nr:hypothetical protein Hi04_10k_c4335_00029 [uncultured bacterium]